MTESEPFFGPAHIPEPQEEVVAWVDLMGTSQIMDWSAPTASINICKLHMAVMESNAAENLDLYPMMDGIYLIGSKQSDGYPTAKVIGKLFNIFSEIIVQRHQEDDEPDVKFSPIIRAGVARGQVYHGSNVTETDLTELPFVDNLVMGKPVVDAHIAERNAPPFGIYIDSSFAKDSEHSDRAQPWWHDSSKEWARKVYDALENCLLAHATNPNIDYSVSKMESHIEDAKEYFPVDE